MFQDCATQWRRDARGRRYALEYPAVESVMRMRGTEDPADTFRRVRLLERGAQEVFQQSIHSR